MSLPTLIRDHLQRTAVSTRGFDVVGPAWTVPWLAYAFSPALSRLAPHTRANFRSFATRLGEGDLYTFANLFEDYPIELLRQALPDVSRVVDAGANVGAFSWLALQIARELHREIAITAVEPADDNVSFLRSQPFADRMEVLHGAVGAEDGFGKLNKGINSVTHTVEEADDGLPMHCLQSLCREPVLLKMDIEGGEFGVLRKGLPENVRSMFLEWHPGPEADRPDDPRSLVTHGEWRQLSSDLYGASTWFWTRS